jgi:hypothetical protein
MLEFVFRANVADAPDVGPSRDCTRSGREGDRGSRFFTDADHANHESSRDADHADLPSKLDAGKTETARGGAAHASFLPRVSGIQNHSSAASTKATDVVESATSNPRVWASVPTVKGAAALAMRPRL